MRFLFFLFFGHRSYLFIYERISAVDVCVYIQIYIYFIPPSLKGPHYLKRKAEM